MAGSPGTVAAAAAGDVEGASRCRLLGRVAAFYAGALERGGEGQALLKSLGLEQDGLPESFELGHCDGRMRGALPDAGQIVNQLKGLGVLDARGREVFLGRITVPIRDGAGNVVDLCGWTRGGGGCGERYLRGSRRGVFNGCAAKSHRSLIVTGGILDAMRIWAAGCRNVIGLHGAEGWGPEHEALVADNGIGELVLALDEGRAGRRMARGIEARAATLGISVQRVRWPAGIGGAGEFFASQRAGDFGALLPQGAPRADAASAGASAEVGISATAEGLAAVIDGRRYELCAIQRPGPSRLRATVRALCAASGRFHIDTVDFYMSRSRRAFVADAARFFGLEPGAIESDLNRLIAAVETHLGRGEAGEAPAHPEVSEPQRSEARRLGRNPDLVGEIQRDMDRLGIIGEAANRLLLYVAMTSRKAEEPLAVQIISSSGAGKSHLLDAVLALCPPEDLVKLTSLSGQALFYKGRESLRHKCLAIAEAGGAEEARYALRNLISDKRLVVESTIKNPLSGRLETQLNTVRGPTAVFETTTRPDTDPETRSRYTLLSMDESSAQTRAILDAQRHAHTLEGRLRRRRREALIGKHHAFQRLLEPVVVVNPFEPLLSYGDDRLDFRRDHPKYLNLILAVSFLHQMGRGRNHDPELGAYVETTLADIAIANGLAHELFGHSLDDLSVPGREALERIGAHVGRRARELGMPAERVEFSRRELREAFGWSDTRLRVYLRELVEMEYLVPTGGRNGLRYRYRLLEAGAPGPRRVPGLKDVETLRGEARLAGLGRHPAGGSPQADGGVSGPDNIPEQKRLPGSGDNPAADGGARTASAEASA